MKLSQKLIPLCLISLLIGSCSTARFSVTSNPLDADVFVEDITTGERKPLGKTPLNIPSKIMRETVGPETLKRQFFIVSVEKQGYTPQRLAVPAGNFGTLVTMLDVKLKEGEQKKELRVAQDVIDSLFLAQKLALKKDFDRAQIELDRILSVAPEFSRALTMRASIYYVQKNYSESLKWYEAALKVDPNMDDAIKMIARIRAASGGRLPAAATKVTKTEKGADGK